MKKKTQKIVKNAKKPALIGAACAGAAALAVGLGKAFHSMKKNAQAQHEVDKAEFELAKAEAKANFEENRGHNTFAKAKEDAKKSWDDAHMSIAEREAVMQEERDARIAEANEKTAEAEARYEAAKK